MAINTVTVSGNLTRDPELRTFAQGRSMLSFCVAVNERKKNAQTGEWEDDPSFVDCVRFDGNAEWLSGRLAKGDAVAVSGRLKQSRWTDEHGNKRAALKIIASEVVPLSARSKGDGQADRQQQAQADIYGEEIPF